MKALDKNGQEVEIFRSLDKDELSPVLVRTVQNMSVGTHIMGPYKVIGRPRMM